METPANNFAADFLVVDDDSVFRTRLVCALKDRGLVVVGCDSVESAIAILQVQKFSRAVVDLKMPGRNGLELIEYLAKHCTDCNTVVLTGYGSIASALSAIKLGAINYLTKPTGVTQILEAFNENAARHKDLPIPSLSQVEWEHIQRVIRECDGNISQAAKLLGMHRRSLQRKLQKPPVNIS